ncbi:TonB-dependent receptor [Natronoflexus pectinivorans]|uniref:Outer membrane receptor protein involved in Fe transport n=1 Tax=Natronoflexus pectinivorans TaxID=682526 RepID=A0A4R2GJ17_9BACT|nr:TonB-dependent receptor [Natronoflexus pectinivorans]TCO08702.1 outer membrane receptor protein involved in Fe transport [Natronoflexus pectinivorans]
MIKKLLCATWMLCVTAVVSSQVITVSGTISDSQTGEPLISANVYDVNTLTGTVSNLYGFYSVKFPSDSIRLIASFTGYQSIEKNIWLRRDTVVNFMLTPTVELDEVVVTGNSPLQSVQSTQMGTINLSPSTTDILPVLIGEKDIIKTLQLMPGVQGGTEGASGFYVRGGGPDQNLILLDGVPVYNVSHLFGFISVFNSDAIRNVTLTKGGFPARYGGRLSSVLDVRMKEGNNKEFKGEASIGILSSSVTLEGPIIKDRTSFMVSGRRSYFDLLTYPFQMMYNKENDDENIWIGYFLHDFNGKVNHIINDKHRLYFSIYTGKDKFFARDKYKSNWFDGENHYSYQYNDKIGLNWGNTTVAFRWNYFINQELFANFTATVSNYKFQIYNDYKYSSGSTNAPDKEDYFFEYYSQIRDFGLKADFDYIPNNDHYVRFGFQSTLHQFSPGVTVFREQYNDAVNPTDTVFGNRNIPAYEFIAYAEDDWSINHWLKINAGLHFSIFNVQNKAYASLEPRLSSRFLLSKNLSLKASYARMQQYLHLLANSSMGLPTDLWVPSTKKIKPQVSDQVSLGLTYALNNQYEFSVEGYYKWMDRLIDYQEGAGFFDLNRGDWEELVTTGTGESYGVEFFAQKNSGKLTGWLGYTLSWSNRQFEEISFGNKFPYSYDSRHDIAIAATYKINERRDFGAVWTYRTGYPFTLEDEKYNSQTGYFPEPGLATNANQSQYDHYGYIRESSILRIEEIEHFQTRNNYRMPGYHRLDVGFNFHKQRERTHRTWSLGVYNAYGRKNPFMIYTSKSYDWNTGVESTRLKQLSLFSFIPYVRWSIKF